MVKFENSKKLEKVRKFGGKNELAFLRRWWSLLSVALHDSIAAALDPSLDVAEGLFPVADAIDVWARDPPHTSVLGCPA